tara:strand:- start:30 stop:794 length:765 start_codon:yes stop_codon:yes gene_type:complete
MQLPADLCDHYWEKGWVVVEGVFPAERVRAVAALATELAEADLAAYRVAAPSGVQTSYWADASAEGESAPRKLTSPFTKHPQLRELVLDPGLREMLQSITVDPPVLLSDQILMKPPRFGSAKPYHQDNAYFLLDPADAAVTAWIALDDVDEQNGCLRYIDGSHHEGLLPHHPIPGEEHNKVPPPDLIDLSKESLAPVGAGGVVLHHTVTLHTSHRNESDRWRRGYATHWGVRSIRSSGDIVERAYFQQPDYPAD